MYRDCCHIPNIRYTSRTDCLHHPVHIINHLIEEFKHYPLILISCRMALGNSMENG